MPKKLWQYPLVDIVKYAKNEKQLGIKKQGHVVEAIDKTHGKPVFLMKGHISAKNTVTIPVNPMENSLELVGNYLYLQVLIPQKSVGPREQMAAPKQKRTRNQNQQQRREEEYGEEEDNEQKECLDVFVFHVDVLTRDDLTIRMSFSNLYHAIKVGSTSISFPIGELLPVNQWTVFALDLESIVRDVCKRSYKALKALTLCSSMSFRNAYTSDIIYDFSTLPRDMYLTVPKRANWEDMYHWCWFPERPAAVLSERVLQFPKEPLPDVSTISAITHPLELPPGSASSYLAVSKHSALGSRAFETQNSSYLSNGNGRTTTVEHNNSHEQLQAEKRKQYCLHHEAIVECKHVIGFSDQYTSNVTWTHQGHIVYSCFNQIIVMNIKNREQRVFMGHTGPVCGIAVDGKGILMVSAQGGPDALVRIWNIATGETIGFLKGHHRDVCCLDISHNGNTIVVVGIDKSARHKVAVWDISKIMQSGLAMLLVSKSTVFHIHKIQFVPYEEERMVSCGRDNIRFWRVYKGLLREVSVDTSTDSRNDLIKQNFLDLSFEKAFLGTNSPDSHRLYVSTQSGAVYEIMLKKRTIEYVFQLHNAAIHTLDVNEGMCVTGSDDKFLRVWPLDFSDYFLEAEHDSAVRSVSLSGDGLRITVGTIKGSMGTLDLTNQNYETVVRSHTGRVLMLAQDPQRHQFTTVSSDYTIRVWDLDTYAQIFQFDTVGECPICITYHPNEHWIACGFDSGVVRIFDVSTATVLQEYRAHSKSVSHLLFTADARWLISSSSDSLCIVDCNHMYQPVRVMHYVSVCEAVSIAFSPDNTLLASVGPAGNIVHLFSTNTFEEKFTFESASSNNFVAVRFSADSKEIVAITTDSRILRINIAKGKVVHELANARDVDMHCLDVGHNGKYIVTGAEDGSICVWDASLRTSLGTQTFSGHSACVNQVMFSRDMQKILSVGDDNAIYVWGFKGETETDLSLELENHLTRKTQEQQREDDMELEDEEELMAPNFTALIDQLHSHREEILDHNDQVLQQTEKVSDPESSSKIQKQENLISAEEDAAEAVD